MAVCAEHQPLSLWILAEVNAFLALVYLGSGLSPPRGRAVAVLTGNLPLAITAVSQEPKTDGHGRRADRALPSSPRACPLLTAVRSHSGPVARLRSTVPGAEPPASCGETAVLDQLLSERDQYNLIPALFTMEGGEEAGRGGLGDSTAGPEGLGSLCLAGCGHTLSRPRNKADTMHS